MALGFAAAPWIAGPAGLRRGRAAALGGSFLVTFALLRGLSLYGEPRPWAAQARGPLTTFLSVLDCTKYPPSLQYLLVTLGLSLLILVLLDRVGTRSTLGLRVLGRVPLFYYLLHVPLLHLGARLLVRATLAPGAELEPSLGRVYLGWVLTLLLLWPLCRAWDRLKSTRDRWWLRYL